MAAIAFSQLPWVVRGATAATGFIGWVLFEELVIDRHGLWQYLPFYRVGNLCLYDLAAATLIAIAFIRLNRIPGGRR